MDGSQVNKLEALFSTEVSLTEGTLDDAIEKYFELGWTDGLPVVPIGKARLPPATAPLQDLHLGCEM